jgi:hypothetical protein
VELLAAVIEARTILVAYLLDSNRFGEPNLTMCVNNRKLTEDLKRILHVLFLVNSLGGVIAFTSPYSRGVVVRENSLPIKQFEPITRKRYISRLQWGFFRRDNNSSEGTEEKVKTVDTTSGSDAASVTTTTNVEVSSNVEKDAVVVVEIPKVLTPEEEATRLRNEAAKSRLEAERMDAELTLRKIEKLEKALKKQQMEAAMVNGNNTTVVSSGSSALKKNPEEIQREIDTLLKKVRGEAPTQTHTSSVASTTSTSATPVSTASASEPLWPNYVLPYDEEECQKYCDSVSVFPQFMLATMALQFEMELEVDQVTNKTKPVDAKKLGQRIDQVRRQDFSFSKLKPPLISPQQVSELQKEIETFMASDKYSESKTTGSAGGMNWWKGDDNTVVRALFQTDDGNFMIQTLKDDERYQPLWDAKDSKSIAQLILEYQYYMSWFNVDEEKNKEQIVSLIAEDEWLKPFVSASNVSGTNAIIETLYPKCTTKKDIAPDEKESPIPTEAAVKKLIADILPKAKFQASSKPEPVLGGYIVRGTTTLSGDAFIDQLDNVMEKSNLKNQMSVFYVNDFTVLAEEIDFDSSSTAPPMFPGEEAPVLYVTSANVCREPLPIRLSIVSAFGLATSWYFSVYPFLLNPSIATRVDEQLAIADANMVPDLSWLSDLSLPLFATFMSIQLSHELGHLIVAGANGIKTSPPTFVPSLFTGITSTVTTFRTPPKNTATMFDYAAAGPIAGVITSILAIAVGCQITAVATDMSLFPSLPLEILRQSTLGGGVIEYILGNGALSLPRAAIGTAAVAGMTVPLHPIAVAGFISLIINALALLPIGSKLFVYFMPIMTWQ